MTLGTMIMTSGVVSVNEWQMGEIKKALVEADRGDFASDKEMQQTIRRLTRRAR